MRHIDIRDPKDCSGCGACAQSCPKQCIGFVTDLEGFSYPKVDTGVCIECGICKTVCPFIEPYIEEGNIDLCCAAINKSEQERQRSSSGGIFVHLARKIIADGGVVFGAKFNSDWSVSHGYAITESELAGMSGSKYVQSDTGDTYSRCKEFLRQGCKVLYSGTPCQISGLNKYLKNKYKDRLLTVEVICHGVPSPGVWKAYLEEYQKVDEIRNISFRAKDPSWEQFSMKIDYDETTYIKHANEDLYVSGFLRNLYLRPSCYACKCRNGISGADITLGDFWGIDNVLPDLNDHKGVSLVICHSKKGVMVFESLDLNYQEVETSTAIKFNQPYCSSVPRPYKSDIFWKQYRKKGISCLPGILKTYTPTLKNRIVNKFYTTLIYRK